MSKTPKRPRDPTRPRTTRQRAFDREAGKVPVVWLPSESARHREMGEERRVRRGENRYGIHAERTATRPDRTKSGCLVVGIRLETAILQTIGHNGAPLMSPLKFIQGPDGSWTTNVHYGLDDIREIRLPKNYNWVNDISEYYFFFIFNFRSDIDDWIVKNLKHPYVVHWMHEVDTMPHGLWVGVMGFTDLDDVVTFKIRWSNNR
jgi:hypothetical protein